MYALYILYKKPIYKFILSIKILKLGWKRDHASIILSSCTQAPDVDLEHCILYYYSSILFRAGAQRNNVLQLAKGVADRELSLCDFNLFHVAPPPIPARFLVAIAQQGKLTIARVDSEHAQHR